MVGYVANKGFNLFFDLLDVHLELSLETLGYLDQSRDGNTLLEKEIFVYRVGLAVQKIIKEVKSGGEESGCVLRCCLLFLSESWDELFEAVSKRVLVEIRICLVVHLINSFTRP